MQAVLCDICNQQITGSAVELHLFSGEVVPTDRGVPRLVRRDGSSMAFLCEVCASWTKEAMDHLRVARASVPPRPLERARQRAARSY